VEEAAEDPGAYQMTIFELERLHEKLSAALTEHDHHVKVVRFTTALQRGPAPGELRAILDSKPAT
jgi:hypothetical protein